MFWANSSQYFDYRLQAEIPDYDFHQARVVNKEQIDKRNEERDRFIEFHYALGGILLYRKQYKTLNYFFEYSQSQPPKYVLLPQTTTQIFDWFDYFRNEFKQKTSIDLKYYFPELDNLGNSSQVNYWICTYIATLFLRQYSLDKYYTYQDFTTLPHLSDDVLELSSLLDSVSYFEEYLKDVLVNKQLIEDIGFEKIVELNRNDFFIFISNLKDAIKSKIGQQKFNANLSDDKISLFYSKSNEIISKAFEVYKPIFIEKDEEHLKSKLKLSIKGERTLMSKSAFVDNDMHNSNYDSFFADTIATYNIKRFIPNTFLVARTKRYLFNKDNILLALIKIVGNNNDTVIIIVLNVSYQLQEVLEKSNYKSCIQYIPSIEPDSQDMLFVLQKNDLPAIEHIELEKVEETEFQLVSINKDLKLYASIIDINVEKNSTIKDKWNSRIEPDNEDLKVQLCIAFLSIIYFKNEREIIQINIASEYREQGIQNDINDIEPLSINVVKN